MDGEGVNELVLISELFSVVVDGVGVGKNVAI
jgi:hypothetical protein